jgi:hypothetical protein
MSRTYNPSVRSSRNYTTAMLGVAALGASKEEIDAEHRGRDTCSRDEGMVTLLIAFIGFSL